MSQSQIQQSNLSSRSPSLRAPQAVTDMAAKLQGLTAAGQDGSGGEAQAWYEADGTVSEDVKLTRGVPLFVAGAVAGSVALWAMGARTAKRKRDGRSLIVVDVSDAAARELTALEGEPWLHVHTPPVTGLPGGWQALDSERSGFAYGYVLRQDEDPQVALLVLTLHVQANVLNSIATATAAASIVRAQRRLVAREQARQTETEAQALVSVGVIEVAAPIKALRAFAWHPDAKPAGAHALRSAVAAKLGVDEQLIVCAGTTVYLKVK